MHDHLYVQCQNIAVKCKFVKKKLSASFLHVKKTVQKAHKIAVTKACKSVVTKVHKSVMTKACKSVVTKAHKSVVNPECENSDQTPPLVTNPIAVCSEIPCTTKKCKQRHTFQSCQNGLHLTKMVTKVLHSIHPNMTISFCGMYVVHDFLGDVFDCIIETS